MDDFDYSTDAKNVLNVFYGVDKILYVEGDDDIPFWEAVFDKVADFTVEVEAVGGKPELLKHVETIRSNEAEFLVAMDSDYDVFWGEEKSPLIIKTFGYSIENTLITSDSIFRIIKILARRSRSKISKTSCENWFDDLNQKMKDFVLLDLVNAKEKLGVQVIPPNSSRFMKSKNSSEFCSEKIKEYIDDLPIEACEYKLKENEDKITEFGLSYCEILKGHFLFSAVLRFIKSEVGNLGKAISITNDLLYSNFIAIFQSSFNAKHPHYDYYQSKVSLISIA